MGIFQGDPTSPRTEGKGQKQEYTANLPLILNYLMGSTKDADKLLPGIRGAVGIIFNQKPIEGIQPRKVKVGINYTSVHRTPEKTEVMYAIIREIKTPALGSAGMIPGLPTDMAAKIDYRQPTIAVPVGGGSFNGVDSFMAIQMPPGYPIIVTGINDSYAGTMIAYRIAEFDFTSPPTVLNYSGLQEKDIQKAFIDSEMECTVVKNYKGVSDMDGVLFTLIDFEKDPVDHWTKIDKHLKDRRGIQLVMNTGKSAKIDDEGHTKIYHPIPTRTMTATGFVKPGNLKDMSVIYAQASGNEKGLAALKEYQDKKALATQDAKEEWIE